MRTVVAYPGGEVDLPLEADRVVATWDGPRALDSDSLAQEIATALEFPLDFPSLQRALVPGDRVLLAVDSRLPDPRAILGPVVDAMLGAGVDREGIAISLAAGSSPNPGELRSAVADLGLRSIDRREFAYLATTAEGRRVYLDREATDADFVLPIGVLAQTAGGGWSGPWTAIDPGLTSDTGAVASTDPLEVSRLLGNQFQIGVVPGIGGIAAVVAGFASSVLAKGIETAERAWTLRVDRRADLVVLGLGEGAGLDAALSAFATGAKLARRGGKIVVLSDASGPIGSATLKLSGADRFDSADVLLAGTEAEPDHASARALKEALDWADLYLWSGIDADEVEDLGLIPLGHPREARRLAESAIDAILVNHAEWTRALVSEDES